MKKTLVSIILALVLVLSCAVAENSPSASIVDTIPGKVVAGSPSASIVDTITGKVGSENLDGFAIFLTAVEPESIEEIVFQKVSGEGFEGVELSEEAVMDEFHKLNVIGYKAEYGDVMATFAYITAYEADTKLTAVVGIINGEAIEWYALEANIVDDGVEVEFPQAILGAASFNNAVMALIRG